MKNRIIIAAAMLLVAGGIAIAQSIARSAVFVKVNSSTSSSAQFTNNTFTVRSAMVIGKKSLTATNTTAVRIGWATNTTYFVINPGQAYVIEFADKREFRLSDLYFDVETANDGVVVSYE
jgi:hypothetical protein